MSNIAFRNFDLNSVERGFFELAQSALLLNEGIEIIRVEERTDAGGYDLLVKRPGTAEKWVTMAREAINLIVNRQKLDDLVKEFAPLVPQFVPDPADLHIEAKAS